MTPLKITGLHRTSVYVLAACVAISIPLTAAAQQAATKQPSKIPDIVQQRIKRIQALPHPPEGAEQFSSGLIPVSPAGELDLQFHAAKAVGRAEEKDLEALGATILSSTARLNWPPGMKPLPGLGIITARIPYDQVAVASELPWVVAVTVAEKPSFNVGAFLSEGVPLHHADAVQSQVEIDGTGVTVGVISNGVQNLAASPLSAPGSSPIGLAPGCSTGTGDEGTAMLEILRDMAPGATLEFCGAGANGADFIQALINLTHSSQPANVIATDVAFDTEPVFQKGPVATAIDQIVTSMGVSVHSAAGNLGAQHAPRIPAVQTAHGPNGNPGPFLGCPYNPTNVITIASDGGTPGHGDGTTFSLSVTPGNAGSLHVMLQWSEPRAIFPTQGAGGFTDLDLFVMDDRLTQCLGYSIAVQGNGSGDTLEQVEVSFPPGTTPVPVKLVVNMANSQGAVANPMIDLRWRALGTATVKALNATARAGSLDPENNFTDGAVSVGAVNASISTNPASVPLADLSAAGPIQLVSTTVCAGGSYPCTIGVAGPPGTTLTAPSWTAASGVSISGAGGFGTGICPASIEGQCQFFGTSASAPHSAGIDALYRQVAGPTPSIASINLALAETAVSRGAANFEGAGVLDALAAIVRAVYPTSASPNDHHFEGGTNATPNFPDGTPVQIGPGETHFIFFKQPMLLDKPTRIFLAFKAGAPGTWDISAVALTRTGTLQNVTITRSQGQFSGDSAFGVTSANPQPGEFKEVILRVHDTRTSGRIRPYQFTADVVPQFRSVYTPDAISGATDMVKNLDPSNGYSDGATINLETTLSTSGSVTGDFSAIDSNFNSKNVVVSSGTVTPNGSVFTISYPISQTDTFRGSGQVVIHAKTDTALGDNTAPFMASVPGFTLKVSAVGGGFGAVISAPQGINCPPTCTAIYPSGTAVSLTVTTSSTSTFSGWGGDCSGAAVQTQITMDTNKTCTFSEAFTTPLAFSLTSAACTSGAQYTFNVSGPVGTDFGYSFCPAINDCGGWSLGFDGSCNVCVRQSSSNPTDTTITFTTNFIGSAIFAFENGGPQCAPAPANVCLISQSSLPNPCP